MICHDACCRSGASLQCAPRRRSSVQEKSHAQETDFDIWVVESWSHDPVKWAKKSQNCEVQVTQEYKYWCSTMIWYHDSTIYYSTVGYFTQSSSNIICQIYSHCMSLSYWQRFDPATGDIGTSSWSGLANHWERHVLPKMPIGLTRDCCDRIGSKRCSTVICDMQTVFM